MIGREDKIIMMSPEGYSKLVDTTDGKNLFWTSDLNVELPIKMKQYGPGSE